ncbi:LANO_0B05776g1_1 [Lachancea nothofagi CBS 11611]|uniref:ATP synthase F(0) complex subunit e, mitochondrial n=1 Tax=Lachancea nothofagi CBS 11611 TaxID=1266666 RepID=A0A1G4IYT4_9SACH|nr:LANO_0B05776g1_1 [Lachancea nothofagi CBS 11611]
MSTINILRYSAVALGIAVGLKTDFGLKSEASKKSEQKAYADKIQLIEQAKAEYTKLHAPKTLEKQGSSIKLDLEDPNLDYSKVIMGAVESLKQ